MTVDIRRYGPYLAITAAGLAVAALAAAFPLPNLDTFSRYAVMAEEFAAGNWREAFHPRFGLGFPAVAGTLAWITGLDGYRCCCLAAALGWTLGLFAFHRLARQLFGERVGWFALVLYVICPQTLLWVFKGLREAYKTAGLLFVVSGILARARREPGSPDASLGVWEMALGLPLLCLFRNDAMLMALVLGLVYAGFDRFGRRTWGLFAWAALLLQLPCWLNYLWTGWWFPVYQAIGLLKRLGAG